MALKIECPKCGSVGVSFVRGVCRACYMRDYHQRRSASAVTECPKCGVVSANFVHGVCRACYMRDYHQRRSASLATDGGGQRLCVECGEADAYSRGLCRPCYMRNYRQRRSASDEQSAPDKQTVFETPKFICDSEGQPLCGECKEPSTYSRGLCHNCYLRDNRRRHRMKGHTCIVCGVSFESARRDALYCSMTCRQRAHRVRNASSTDAPMISSAAYATAGAAAKVSAAVMRGLYRPRRLLSIYRPVAASQVAPATRRRS
jgi:NMD protein affecting ribosome stability and mRNA decay